MNNISIRANKNKSLIKPIIIAGLTAGTLDAIGAIVVYNANPFRMFQHIASGAIGHEQAFSGEWATALLGAGIHFFIAFCWTIIFFLIFPSIQKFRINRFILGILYGAVVWVIMNMIVLPLSQIAGGPLALKQVLIGMSILMVMIGIPISLFAHRYYAENSRQ
jgi:hypothetical protein